MLSPDARADFEYAARRKPRTTEALFAERARAICLNVVLTERDTSATIEISLRLDGIPLAIEVAPLLRRPMQ